MLLQVHSRTIALFRWLFCKKNNLWFNLPIGHRSLSSISSVLGSRKKWNLVQGVVERHKCSFVIQSLANWFVSVLVLDFPFLQNSWDVWWSLVKKKVQAFFYWCHHFRFSGNNVQEDDSSKGQEVLYLHWWALCQVKGEKRKSKKQIVKRFTNRLI